MTRNFNKIDYDTFVEQGKMTNEDAMISNIVDSIASKVHSLLLKAQKQTDNIIQLEIYQEIRRETDALYKYVLDDVVIH